jgi:hypothetical protein
MKKDRDWIDEFSGSINRELGVEPPVIPEYRRPPAEILGAAQTAVHAIFYGKDAFDAVTRANPKIGQADLSFISGLLRNAASAVDGRE